MIGFLPDREIANTLIEGKLKFKNHGALIISEVNRRFLTGFHSTAGAVLITPDCSYFLTDFRYIQAAKSTISHMEVMEHHGLAKAILELCAKHKIKTLHFEQKGISIFDFNIYENALSGIKSVADSFLDSEIDRLRIIKNASQLENVKKAQTITELAYNTVLKTIKCGMTEREIATELEYLMKKNGAEKSAFDLIVVSGENGSKPHGVPSDKKIENGDFITMDIGAVYNGYHSDMTRTVAVGQVSDKQRKIYYTVLKAQLSALSAIKAGVKCSDIDKTARDIITDAGYGQYFGHSTGHGVGMEVHEAPNISSGNNEILKEGMIITDEPGIYIPGEFGVRIEDMVYVTENGCKNLTNITKDLVIIC